MRKKIKGSIQSVGFMVFRRQVYSRMTEFCHPRGQIHRIDGVARYENNKNEDVFHVKYERKNESSLIFPSQEMFWEWYQQGWKNYKDR